jgi:hypothetical protein
MKVIVGGECGDQCKKGKHFNNILEISYCKIIFEKMFFIFYIESSYSNYGFYGLVIPDSSILFYHIVALTVVFLELQ